LIRIATDISVFAVKGSMAISLAGSTQSNLVWQKTKRRKQEENND
jgi:hypothetical protein